MHPNKGVYNCGRRLKPMKIRITPAYTAPYTLWRENVWFCLFFCFLFIFFFVLLTWNAQQCCRAHLLHTVLCECSFAVRIYARLFTLSLMCMSLCDAAYPLASALVAVAGLLFCHTWKVFCEPKNINGITCSFFGSSTFCFFLSFSPIHKWAYVSFNSFLNV